MTEFRDVRKPWMICPSETAETLSVLGPDVSVLKV
jgi:hypothetical protein